VARLERLDVRVDGNELRAGDSRAEHAVDLVAAAAADAEHLDVCHMFGDVPPMLHDVR
jgi:hypothetical protein